MKTWAKSIIAVVVFFVASSSGMVLAEWDYYGYGINGEIEMGWRFFLDRPSGGSERGKFEEYRDIPPGIFLEGLHILAIDKNEQYVHELIATNAGYEDQRFLARTSRVGLYRFEFEWDQIPHELSEAHPRFDDIDLRRDTARFAFSYTPTSELDFDVEYRFTNRDGERPKGAAEDAFEFPESPYEFNNFLEPVRYEDHDVRLTAGWAQKLYQLQLSYNYSLFENDRDFSRIDREDLRDRVALPPDNMAHYITLAGGLNLPYRTRVNSAFSYGLRLQDEGLVPSLNPPAGGSDPEFDGQVSVFHYFLSGKSRPIDPLTLNAFYRLYSHDDQSDQSDVEDIESARYSFMRHTAGLDAKWQFQWPVTLMAGYHFQRWDRDGDIVEVEETSEHTPKISLDYRPSTWLSVGASYSHSIRNGSGYHPNSDVAALPPGHTSIPPGTSCTACHGAGAPLGGNPLMRRFNLADRDRDAVDFFTELTPLDNLTLSANVSMASDDYDDSPFGLQDDENWSAGVDISWRPIPRLALHASYMHEEYETRQRVDEDDIDIDPGRILVTEDDVDTVGIGGTAVLIPQKLDLDMNWSLSYANSDLNNRRLPDIEDTLTQYKTYLRYHFSGHWSAKIGYIYETFDITDAYRERLVTSPDDDHRLFLSDYYEDYTAHIIVLGVKYRF